MIEIITGSDPSGLPGLRFAGCGLHDPDRPMDQARQRVRGMDARSPSLVLVFGLGLGYHLAALAERWPEAVVVAFEPEPGLGRTFEEYKGLLPALPTTFLACPSWEEFDAVLTKHVVHGRHPNPVVFIAPGYETLFPGEVRDFGGMIRAARVRRASDDLTRAEKGLDFINHLAANTGSILARGLVTGLAGRMAPAPVFVVGSGPGLDKNGELLRKASGRAWIIAGSSALKPLLAMGVRPDIVTAVEADDTSRFFTFESDPPDCILALASCAHPAHFSAPGFRQAVFHLTPGAAYLFDTPDFVPQAGTAGSAAFVLAFLFGLDPIVLVGQDMAFAPDRIHASGTPGDEPVEKYQAPFYVRTFDGRAAPTHSAFASSLHWFAESAAYIRRTRPDRMIFNATESGAEIPGVPSVRLEQVMDRLGPARLPHGLDDLQPGLPRPDAGTVRGNVDLALGLIQKLSSLHRLDPGRAAGEMDFFRRSHPFVGEAMDNLALGGLDPWTAARELENALLIMREAVS